MYLHLTPPPMNCSLHTSHMYYTHTHAHTATHNTYTSSDIHMHTTHHGKYMLYPHYMCTCTVNIQTSYIYGERIFHSHYIHMYTVMDTYNTNTKWTHVLPHTPHLKPAYSVEHELGPSPGHRNHEGPLLYKMVFHRKLVSPLGSSPSSSRVHQSQCH